MDGSALDLVMARRRFLVVAAALAATTLSGCTAGDSPPSASASGTSGPSSPDAQAPKQLVSDATRRAPGDPSAARTAMADFGASFLRAAYGTGPNIVISPYSLFTVLAMARAGALGQTAEQLDAALRSSGVDALGAAVTAVDDGIAAAVRAAEQAGETIAVHTANQTWLQQGFPVRQEYLDRLAGDFGESAVEADFQADPEAVRADINSWIAERTRDLIPELFGFGTITDATVLALVNALYLKAQWAQPFTADSEPLAFITTAGEVVAVPALRAPLPLSGAATAEWSSVSIPYVGHGISMTLLVPAPGAFDAVLAGFDADMLAAATGVGQVSDASNSVSYQLTMPPFAIDSVPDARRAAEQLGIVDIFTESADLSGIAGEPGDLYAQAFVHQAVINVDENGTEAAAATGMSVGVTSAPIQPEILTVDRPYLFWISEAATGAPLFLGVVIDPRIGK